MNTLNSVKVVLPIVASTSWDRLHERCSKLVDISMIPSRFSALRRRSPNWLNLFAAPRRKTSISSEGFK